MNLKQTLVGSKPLTFSDIIEIKEKIPNFEEVYTNFYFEDYIDEDLSTEEINTDLMNDDFIIGTVKIDNVELNVIHAFPGGNPRGVFWENKSMKLFWVPEFGTDFENAPSYIKDWYDIITLEATTYKDDFWYANL